MLVYLHVVSWTWARLLELAMPRHVSLALTV